MLNQIHIKGFKSIYDVKVELPQLTVLFGPNASGKSNFLDALQALSRIGTSRTLSEALSEPIRGYPVEKFTFPSGGLPELLSKEKESFSLETTLSIAKEKFLYKVEIEIQPRSGMLFVKDEYLATLSKKGEPKGNPPIQKMEGQWKIRRKSKPGNPRTEKEGLNYTILSDPRFGGVEYRAIEKCRNELLGWKTYYLDPRVAMRSAKPPADVRDIGVLGDDIAPFLYRLSSEKPRNFEAIKRTLMTLIPSIENLMVELDKRRGTLDILIRQGGRDFSSRVISEGTLRVLALCAIAANPWSGSLLAFEEPENGIHPRRLELIANLFKSLALEYKRQIIITTHSSLFCNEILKLCRSNPKEFALLCVTQSLEGTKIAPFNESGPLLADKEIKAALTSGTEDGLFGALILRGMLDG